SERKNSQPVTRAQNLPNKVGSGFLFEGDFLVSAHAGVDHDRQVQRLRSFRLELVDLLLNAFLEKLESLSGQVRGRAVLFVEHADKHINEVHVDADAAPLGGGILRFVLWSAWRRLHGFSWLAIRSRGGRRRRRGSAAWLGGWVATRRGLALLRPGRTVRLV